MTNPLCHCVTSPPKGETQICQALQKALPCGEGGAERREGFCREVSL